MKTAHMENSGDSIPNADPEMTARDILWFVNLLERHQIDFYLDGGCGVDALLGEQTRSHADLDIALQHKDVLRLRALLEAQGYCEVPRDDSWECNFVLGDDLGHQIDIHSYTFDENGNHVFGVAYPFDSLIGTGSVGGQPVKCISVEWMAKFHSGYKLDKNDYLDVKALCQRFGIPMPAEFDELEEQEK